ncbi:flagellar basal body rod protein FlgC (plasmid) [Paroceanicella profunda]|uniref:Flagellar basal body rod protein FlgC n=1 Tax=Paroceanicella profunda TaxID=2579971 RepID=A0A5B8FJW0_9RHOB|nr:flagellar basal body rod protein FlgC [Paroceanicella profunda]QDL94778.1 flagellar basal body rod protein FlgC [Paroceanicella profunda]
MESFFGSMITSAHGMVAQSTRLRVTSENIANVDTPGYTRKIVTFEQLATDEGTEIVTTGPITFGKEEHARIRDPAHPLADPDGTYMGSNVDLMVEIADAREAQRTYEANLRMFDQARQMASSFLDLLRT